MRFWDSSALVPLIVREPTSAGCRAELRADPAILAWCLTRVEIVSALRRHHREGGLRATELVLAERLAEKLSGRWTTVDAVGLVEAEAVSLLQRHPLRAADALQLGAARVVARGRPRGSIFVTRDELLAEAATAEGFRAVVPR